MFDEEEQEDLMNVDQILKDVFDQGGIMNQMMPQYLKRDSQVEAIRATIDGLRSKTHVLMEGPCGFGKSFAYLFPALLVSAYTEERVVIATGGITLQEQIFYKDIPLICDIIKKICKVTPKVTYLKGRNNFICMKKFDERLFELGNKKDAGYATVEDKEQEDKILAWGVKTKTGDSSELDFVPDYALWNKHACVNQDDCTGKQCSYYDGKCFYYNMREEAKSANVIITNYHLLFSDIASGGHVLPSYDILICDEGHEMAGISRDFQEVKISHYTFTNIVRRLSELCGKTDFDKEEYVSADMLVTFSELFFASTTTLLDIDDQGKVVTLTTDLDCSELVEQVNLAATEAVKIANKFEDSIFETSVTDDDEDTNDKDIFKFFDALSLELDEIATNLKEICQERDTAIKAYFYQLETNNWISLRSKPIKVSPYMDRSFFGKDDLTAIITSATLSVGESFDYIKEELGIEEAIEFIGESPFNLEEQQLWYLPPHAKNGNERDFIDQMLIDLKEVAETCQGGVLGLFTSNFALSRAARMMRTETNLRILVQGDMPRQQLLDLFKEDEDSVLLGSKSFFTGVDVPGHALRCVFLDKFPFLSPEDPVVKALNKEDGAFFKHSIPTMIISLKQAIGRSVRDVDDKCVVCIADNRMKTARYKGKINNSFNYPKRGTQDIEQVALFLGKESPLDDLPF